MYGNPNSPQYGLHPPFENYIPTINNYPNMDYGFLTGDVVVQPTAAYWDAFESDMDSLQVPFFIAAGNHDGGTEFGNRFGDYYHKFVHNNDLFIILSPNKSTWSITGDQLTFLENTLDSNYSSVNNIFIFIHELIWWSPENEYQFVDINFKPHYPGSTNYTSTIEPLLQSYPNDITVFAGDLGATNKVSPYMYHQYGNITLIGSGMGGGVRDNIIVTDVYNDKVVHKLIAINGSDSTALGSLYDFKLDPNPPYTTVQVYPNPTQSDFNIGNNTDETMNARISKSDGSVISSFTLNPNSVTVYNAEGFQPDLYFVSVWNNHFSTIKKVVIY